MTAQTLTAVPTRTGWLKALQTQHATAVTAITFVISGVTGVMVFFHFGNQYVMGLHEWVGMAMVVGALLHMTRHIKALGKQLQKPRARVWLAAGAVVTGMFVGSALLSPSGGNPMKAFAHQSMDAPVSAIGGVLSLSDAQVKARLAGTGLTSIDLEKSVNQLAELNQVEAKSVLAAVMGSR